MRARRTPLLDATFALLLVVMVAHEAEHVVQVWQKDVRAETCPMECRGLLGSTFDVEWVHAAYNHSILLLLVLLYAGYRMWRREWRRPLWAWLALTVGIFAVQGWHVVEHAVKLDQWLANGHRSPTPGILGRHFSLVELHFTINSVVLALVVAGYLGLGLHRRLRPERTTLAIVGAGCAVLAAVGGRAWAARPPTVRLAAGVHRGPLVLDHAQRLVGAAGSVVRGGILVRADDVIVEGVTVVGGENGIDVDGARGVLLDRVTVRGAKLDGIHVRRSEVVIRRCTIHAGGGRWHQGIDISYTFDLRPSIVELCTVSGGLEGIVTHFARAKLARNRVSGTSLRGITMTEMSMGSVERNQVRDALGVGIFCGDYSRCRIERNVVGRLRPDLAFGDATRDGFGILAHYNAVARLRENRAPRIAAFAGGEIEGG